MQLGTRGKAALAASGGVVALGAVVWVVLDKVIGVRESGTWGEWVAGIGGVLAFGAAVWVGWGAQRIAALDRESAERSGREAREAMVRDRVASRLLDLGKVIERDLARFDQAPPGSPAFDGAEGAALCRSLRPYRNFGAVWAFYCEPEMQLEWIASLARSGQLADRMRGELQEALDQLAQQDRAADD